MPKKVLAQVSILADNVAHVRPVPEGLSSDEVVQEFWVERAAKAKTKPKPLQGRALANALDKQAVNALDLIGSQE